MFENCQHPRKRINYTNNGPLSYITNHSYQSKKKTKKCLLYVYTMTLSNPKCHHLCHCNRLHLISRPCHRHRHRSRRHIPSFGKSAIPTIGISTTISTTIHQNSFRFTNTTELVYHRQKQLSTTWKGLLQCMYGLLLQNEEEKYHRY